MIPRSNQQRYLQTFYQKYCKLLIKEYNKYKAMKDCEQKTSSFLIKLMNMLRSKQNAKTITWDMEESGIRILNQKKLQGNLLPRYFRHNKFTSFVRQLNMYDFHKVYLSDNSSVFYHQIFNPRDKQSVYKIKRKAPPPNDENSGPQKTQKMKILFKSSVPPNIKQSLTKTSKLKKEQTINKSSFKLLLRNQFGSSNQRSSRENQTQQILQQIISHIAPLQLSENSIREKITQLRKYAKFKRFLKRGSFLKKIYAKLGIQMDRDDDKLSQLSIEEQLMINTRKSLTLRSLKMFQSGPINLKDTLGMLLS